MTSSSSLRGEKVIGETLVDYNAPQDKDTTSQELLLAEKQETHGFQTTKFPSKKGNAKGPSINKATSRRPICDRCKRPMPKACICDGLPDHPIQLQRCHVLVLQHPHEARRKNRSLPLVQLCLDDASITVVVSRRFGDQVDPKILNLLQLSKKVLLVFPNETEDDNDNGDDSNSVPTLTLSQARDYCRLIDENSTQLKNENYEKILIVMLDATWKYAREMDKANVATQQYPSHMKRLALSWEDPLRPCDAVRPNRFDIRTPPSQVHLSTAECLAWVLSALEEDNNNNQVNDNNQHNHSNNQDEHQCQAAKPSSLYSTLMKPLDVMVEKWHHCRKNAVDNHQHHHRRKTDDAKKVDDESANYYINPDRKDKTMDETEEAVSRTTFFTMGDTDTVNKKGRKGRKRQRGS